MTIVTLTGTAGATRVSTQLSIASTNASLFPGDPGPGLIALGIGHQGGMKTVAARAAQFAGDVGRSGFLYPKTGRIYITPFASIAQGISQAKAALADAALVKAWGGIPFVDSKEWTALDFAKVGAGQMDQFVDFLMEGAVVLDWPIIIGFHQEPVTDGLGTAADYASAVGRFGQRRDLAGGQGSISVTGCIGFGSFTNATTAQSKGNNGTFRDWAQALAPVCDVPGSHKYLQYESQDEAKWAKGWSLDQLFGQFWDVQDGFSNGRAHVHGETGVHTRAANLATAPQYMDEFLTYAIAHRVRVCSFFDSGLNSNAGGPWTLDCPIQGGNGSIDISRRKHFAQQLLDPRVVGPAALAA